MLEHFIGKIEHASDFRVGVPPVDYQKLIGGCLRDSQQKVRQEHLSSAGYKVIVRRLAAAKSGMRV